MVNHPASDQAAGPVVCETAEASTAVVRGSVPITGLRDFFDNSFRLLPQVIAGQGAAIQGAAFCLYRESSEAPAPDAAVDLELGFAVDCVVQAQDGVMPGRLPAGDVARYVYAGGFDGLGSAWERLRSWIGEHGREAGPLRWEVYQTQPTPDMDPSELRTELNWLLAAAAGTASRS